MADKKKSWPTLGYIKAGDLDPYLKTAKDLDILVDGEKLDFKSVSMPRFFTIWDKATKSEVVIGKFVKKKKQWDDPNSEIQTYVQLEPNVTFESGGKKLNTTAFGNVKSKADKLVEIDKLEAGNIMDESQAESAREMAEYSAYTVTLPPPRD